jgi:hypothetical protein
MWAALKITLDEFEYISVQINSKHRFPTLTSLWATTSSIHLLLNSFS